MTEGTIKQQLCRYLRKRLRDSVVIRHEDKSHGGVPDISVTYRGRTFWLEVKLVTKGSHLAGVTRQQRALGRALQFATQGRAAVVVYSDYRTHFTSTFSRETVVYGFDQCYTDEPRSLNYNIGHSHECVAEFIEENAA